MNTYQEFCRLRDLHIPGVNAPKHTEADAFYMAAAQLAVPDGYKAAPLEPTPEIIAAAAVAAWPTASPADITLARLATPIVLMQMDMAPGTTVDSVAGMLATMPPAYRAMLAAAPAAPAAQGDAKDTGTNDKALFDFVETDHRLHIATTYTGLSYVPTFEVAKLAGHIGNEKLIPISSGTTLREAIAAAIASSKAVES